MADVWVLDASPLILLGKVGQATLPTRLAEVVVVPDGVVSSAWPLVETLLESGLYLTEDAVRQALSLVGE